MPISAGLGNRLQIFVENQGRINYNIPNDFKGIVGNVTLNNVTLVQWTMTGFPFDNYDKLNDVIRDEERPMLSAASLLRRGPAIFQGKLEIPGDELGDSYIDTKNWGKVSLRMKFGRKMVRFDLRLHLGVDFRQWL